MAEMTHCPNCGTPWPNGAAVCPHCGWQQPNAAWPPAPVGGFVQPPPPPMPRLVTGRAWADLTAGIFTTLMTSFIGGLGIVVMPVLYFIIKPNYPVFARGIGYGILGVFALMLGALAWCFATVFSGHQG